MWGIELWSYGALGLCGLTPLSCLPYLGLHAVTGLLALHGNSVGRVGAGFGGAVRPFERDVCVLLLCGISAEVEQHVPNIKRKDSESARESAREEQPQHTGGAGGRPGGAEGRPGGAEGRSEEQPQHTGGAGG